MLFRFVDDDQQRLRRLLLLIKLIRFHNSIHEHHKLLRPAIGHPRDLPWAKLYQSSDPASFLHMTGLTRKTFGRPWCLCPSSPTRTASFVRPWRVSWSASFLSGKHNAIQASVSAFWDHSVSLCPCNKYDAEKGGPDARVSPNCADKVPRCHEDEEVYRHGQWERTAGWRYHRIHGRCFISFWMHWQTRQAECLL